MAEVGQNGGTTPDDQGDGDGSRLVNGDCSGESSADGDAKAELPRRSSIIKDHSVRGRSERPECEARVRDRSARPECETGVRDRSARPECETGVRDRSARPECETGVRDRSARPECETGVRDRSARPECETGVRDRSARPECETGVRDRSARPECETGVRDRSARPECETGVRDRSARPECETGVRDRSARPECETGVRDRSARPECETGVRDRSARPECETGVRDRSARRSARPECETGVRTGVRDRSARPECETGDGSRQRKERKKTVSFSSMPTEKKISRASDCLSAMVEGTELKKVRSNSRVYHRYFLLDADMQSLRWEPSKKESDKAKIDVKSVKEVRTGKNTDTFRTNGTYEQISEDCAFSIIFGDNYESLDLVANTADIANIWVTGLRYLISYGKHSLNMIESSQNNMRSSWLSQLFDKADNSNSKQISICTAVQLIKELNPGLKNVKTELKFKELLKAKDKVGSDVTREEFIEVYHDLCTRPEIYFLFVQFSSNKEFLDTKDLMIFLEAEQGEVTDEDEGAEMSQRLSIESAEQPPSNVHKKFQLSKDLSDLVTLCQSVEFKDFPTSFQSQKPWEFCSFNEVFASRCANDFPGDFVNYNKKFLARIYPSPMRIDSSNMNPQDFWKCGCQIVAMNYQTPGLMMDLNIGWFRQNGNCGYVLRPAIMREQVSYFSANTKDSVPGVSPQLLHIKIISGQNFPKPKGSGAKGDVVDPYVYVEIHGIPADCGEQRTRTVHQNGDNPLFDESFEFQINLPELAMVRFVVLDDDYIGDEFIGQYTIPFECLQPGYRHVPLQSLTGEVLPHTQLFVHVAITNRRGGGKPHKRGLSVRKGKKSREYASMRVLLIRTIDDVFKTALLSLREATDLRENMQNALVSFKELCGLSAVANLKQSLLALCPRLTGPEGAPQLLFNLSDQYPSLEPQSLLPDVLRRVVSSYETMIQTSRAVMESADALCDRILHVQKTAMQFHENLHDLAVKEGLKGRKLHKAVESFTWNITILKGQADLLKHARSEVQENLKQIHYAALTCSLTKGGSQSGEGKARRSLEAIPEKATAEELSDTDLSTY
uniref:Phosphoinositide phospholipase C n=2 Tax=Knipowitschia caucasica TaxID=637954 RepID=A0AAV2MGJ7_KNICA